MLKKLLEDEFANDTSISNTDAVYNAILKAIFLGEIRPGEKINQLHLATELGVSRSPVRDAMLRLTNDKFLEKNKTGGFEVYKINLKDYVDFYEYRINLECFSAYQASHKINQNEINLLSQNLAEYSQEFQQKNMLNLILLDSKFHEIIAKSTKNIYLIDAFMKIKQRAEFFRILTLDSGSMLVASNTHKAIYNALLKHDEKAAAAAMRRDFNFYLKNVYNKI